MMELSREDIELIDRFNKDELSGKELVSFNERMKDAEFASSVSLYNDALKVVRNGGRDELRNVFASIQSKLETTNSFEKYTPGKSKNGGNTGGWFIGMTVVILLTLSYFYFTGKIKPGDINDLIKEDKVDTVYHYIYHTDTIVHSHIDGVSGGQVDTIVRPVSTKTHTIIHKIIRIDTVYQSTQRIYRDSSKDAKKKSFQ